MLRKVGQYLLNFLSGDTDIRVRQTSDELGNCHWDVYDPSTGKSASFASEQEVRIWLDQRYSL